MKTDTDTAEGTRTAPEAGRGPQVIEAAVLLGRDREVVIRHNGRDYRLRSTRLGKLILTA